MVFPLSVESVTVKLRFCVPELPSVIVVSLMLMVGGLSSSVIVTVAVGAATVTAAAEMVRVNVSSASSSVSDVIGIVKFIEGAFAGKVRFWVVVLKSLLPAVPVVIVAVTDVEVGFVGDIVRVMVTVPALSPTV